MSKDQKKMIKLNVETVDNWNKTLAYIMSTLDFWIEKKEWPLDLCYDSLDELSNEMFKIIRENKIN